MLTIKSYYLMKKLIYLLIIFSTTLIACSDDDCLNVKQSNIETPNVLSQSEQAILKSISRRHKVTSRFDCINMLPYIVKGDTVAFIVNYEDGWEIYASDMRLPMMIMRSESGNFYPTQLNEGEPVYDYFFNIASNIKNLRESGDLRNTEVDPSWMAYLPNDDENLSRSKDWHEVASGGSSSTKEYTPLGGRLKTKWDQVYPYNQYTKKVLNPQNVKVNAPTGCSAVGIGQYLFWMHETYGVPKYCPTQATEKGDIYEYSDFKDGWSDLYSPTYSSATMNKVSIFLGYLATKMNAEFKWNETGVDNSVYSGFIKEQTGRTVSKTTGSTTSIAEQLKQGKPVICSSKIINNGRHTYLIDYYKEIFDVTYVYYAYTDPSDGDDEEEDPFADVDNPSLEELEAYYGEIRTNSYYHTSYWYRMNWGWGGNGDNVEVSAYYNPMSVNINNVTYKIETPTIFYTN